MKKLFNPIVVAVFVVASVILPFVKWAEAKTTELTQANKGQLVLKHNKELSGSKLIACSWASDNERGEHGSDASDASDASRYSKE
ncbi:MAG: hypothetical protein V1884_02445 [Candidatus Omnitrophota bacterium]